jgi:CubicO group peptidase (beta-lactamase class C family)
LAGDDFLSVNTGISDITERISDLFNKYACEEDFSGAGLVKAGERIIYQGAHGFAHKGFCIKNTMNTRFDTASVTKLFTACAVLQLVENGCILLNDSVTKYIGLEGTAISDKVTVYHLLTHTSGIADDADEVAGESYEELFINKPNYSIRETVDFLPQFAYKTGNFEPGEGVRYNNCGFVLLGLMIEKASGMHYREYVKKYIFEKAGMMESDFCSMDGIFKNAAEGYVKTFEKEGNFTGWRKNIYSFPPVVSPDGGAFTTVGDLDIFIHAVISGKLIGVKVADEMLVPRVTANKWVGRMEKIGYGFEFVTDLMGRIIYIKKEGCNPGVACQVAYYPSSDITIAILSNQDCNVWKLHREIHEALKEAGII